MAKTRSMRPFMVLALAFGLTACGSGKASNLSATAVLGPKPVFVISGGFLSCKTIWHEPSGTATFTQAKPLLDRLAEERGSSVPYVATCFVFDRDKVRMQTDLGDEVSVGTMDDVAGYVAERVAAAGPGAELVLIGHSWGGWIGMHVAEALGRTIPVRYLETLDPISWRTCGFSTILASITGYGDWDSIAPDENCTSAPKDLDAKSIVTNVTRWAQFYQDRFSFLHSSQVDDAHANARVDYDDMSDSNSWWAHQALDRDERVWSAVGNDFTPL